MRTGIYILITYLLIVLFVGLQRSCNIPIEPIKYCDTLIIEKNNYYYSDSLIIKEFHYYSDSLITKEFHYFNDSLKEFYYYIKEIKDTIFQTINNSFPEVRLIISGNTLINCDSTINIDSIMQNYFEKMIKINYNGN